MSIVRTEMSRLFKATPLVLALQMKQVCGNFISFTFDNSSKKKTAVRSILDICEQLTSGFPSKA